MRSHNSAGWGDFSTSWHFTTTSVCPHSCWDRSALSGDQLATLVRNHFPLGGVGQTGESIRVTAYAVAKAESGGNPSACGDNDRSIGLWQINIDAHPTYDKCLLFEEDYNANAAVEVSSYGNNWNPWCTWEKTACGGNGNEAYKQYLTEARNHFYPKVTSLSVSSTSISLGQTVEIYYSVLDDVGLDRVELWRAVDVNGDGQPDWPPDPQDTKPASGQSAFGYFEDNSHSSADTYWYGIHVVDNSGAPEAWNDERNSRTGGSPGVFGPIQVEVTPETYPPQVTTEGTSSITTSSATLTGNLDSTGGETCQVWFEYGTTTSYGSLTSKLSMSSTGPFSAIISSLNPDTTYHFRACAQNSKGTRYGSDMTFKTEPADQVVTFPDPKLETAIREAIGKPTGDIYQSDLEGLTSLYASERNIVNLAGLEHCTSLTWLELWDNQISDISPLSNLTKLDHLFLGTNHISDLSALSNLINLYVLLLENNQISDVSPLSNLTNLVFLHLSANQISDISALSNLTSLSMELWLESNQISDISPLSGLTSLQGLFLGTNQISDISPLSNITNLKGLRLEHNQVSDISPLSSLTKLYELHLAYNQISDVSPLVQNTGLSEGDRIDLRSNPLSADSLNMYIPQLEARGVNVLHDAPKTWYVDDDLVDYPDADFTKIQDAVNAASPGDAIIVYPGTYTENVDVNKDHLAIQSENGAEATIVQAANPDDYVFEISVDYVNMSGFTVKGATGYSAGICLDHVSHCSISNNTCESNKDDILLIWASKNTISSNICQSNGIHSEDSSNNTITHNTFVNGGLYVLRSYQNTVENNTVNGKPLAYLEDISDSTITDAGQVVLVNCSNITVKNLDLSNTCMGIELFGTNNCKIVNNIMNSNTWNGIALFSNSSNNTISNNTMSGNYRGICSTGSSNNIIKNNNILNNYYGIEHSSNNLIYLNNFIDNAEDNVLAWDGNIWNSPAEITYTYSGNTHTSYLGNYWSDYTGSDADGDGIGDTPYSIDSDADNYPLVEPFGNYEIGPAPYPVITSSLEITPEKDEYYVGDTLTAEFTITNRGMESVTFDVLTVGGRLNGSCPTEGCPDFTHRGVTLQPDESYQYDGSLALTQAGDYHFFCAYHTEEYTPGEDENNWNTNIDVEVDGQIIEDFNEARRYREKDTTVLEETYIEPALGPASWEKLSGPWEEETDPYGDFSALLPKSIAINPNNPEIVYVGSDKGGGLYKSVDGGDSWQEINNGLPHLSWPASSKYWPVAAIAIASSNPDIVYVGTTDINPYHSWVPHGMGVYKSINGGSSWTPANGVNGKQFPKYPISSMVVDPTNADTVYVGTVGGGIWKTPDGGENWQHIWSPIGELCFDVNALAISPANPAIIYAAVYNYVPLKGKIPTGIVFQGGLYKSETGGSSWEKVWGERVDDVVIDNKNASILHAVICGYGVYKSVDGGMNWDDISGTGGEDPLPNPSYDDPIRIGSVYSLTMDPDFTNVIYTANKWDCEAGGIYLSPNSGENWFPIGLQDERVEKITLASDSDYHALYAVTTDGLFKLDFSNSAIVVQKYSPVELRVYDSQEQVTGLVGGEVKSEIPKSVYYNGTITIFSSTDSYHYELVGTAAGSYGLGVTSVVDGEATTFVGTDIPTTSGAVHQYTIDWDALAEGEEGVTIQIDSDGDGEFEDTVTSDEELTQDEFVLQTETVIDFDPDTLNLKSKGKFVTVYIELPPGYDVSQIDVSSITLNGTVPALDKPTKVGDYDSDGVPDLMVKFDGAAVQDLLTPGSQVEITITGEVTGIGFEGSDTIRVINN